MPNIKIRIEKGTQTAGDGQEQQEKQRDAQKEQTKKMALVSTFAHQMIGQAKEIISYSTSHIGEWTGNDIKQANINATLEVLGEVASFGTAIATSAATMNPLPIILQTMSFGVRMGEKAFSDYKEQIRLTRTSQFLTQRSGNATKNGSRGTNN